MSEQPKSNVWAEEEIVEIKRSAAERMRKFGLDPDEPAPVVAEVRRVHNLPDARLLELWREVSGPHAGLNGPLIRFAGKVLEAADSVLRTRLRGLEQQWRNTPAVMASTSIGSANVKVIPPELFHESQYSIERRQTLSHAADELARLLTTPEEP